MASDTPVDNFIPYHIEILIQIPGQELVRMTCSKGIDIISELKNKGYWSKGAKLFFNGEEILGTSSLSELGVKDESLIVLRRKRQIRVISDGVGLVDMKCQNWLDEHQDCGTLVGMSTSADGVRLTVTMILE